MDTRDCNCEQALELQAELDALRTALDTLAVCCSSCLELTPRATALGLGGRLVCPRCAGGRREH
jgi:formylmethanofuran dehydrogenase subunit E